eukprot:jgi/Picre1/32956/NNA_008283.t1
MCNFAANLRPQRESESNQRLRDPTISTEPAQCQHSCLVRPRQFPRISTHASGETVSNVDSDGLETYYKLFKISGTLYILQLNCLHVCPGFILLGGIAASQNKCGATRQDFLLADGSTVVDYIDTLTQGYLSPGPCDTYFSFTWFITFYQIAIAIVAFVIVSSGGVNTWRYGMIGLLMPVFYLLMATANAFWYQMNNLSIYKGSARAVFAGAIIGAVSDVGLLMTLGVRDEGDLPKTPEEE